MIELSNDLVEKLGTKKNLGSNCLSFHLHNFKILIYCYSQKL